MVKGLVEKFFDIIERYHKLTAELIKGNSEPVKAIFSKRDDVSLANPFGGIMVGWKQVQEAVDRTGSLYREGTAAYEKIIQNQLAN